MHYFYKISIVLLIFHISHVSSVTEEDEGVKYANKCEGNTIKSL